MENGEFPHSALTSWSGFIYQGKVAIYHVLHLLLEKREVCDGYSLQLDSLEDFAILDNHESVVSLHQVKAKKTQLYSDYREAIVKLQQRACALECNDAQFHIAQQIRDKTPDEILNNHRPVVVYQYDGLCYCNVDDIDHKINEKIQVLLNNYWLHDGSKQTSEYANKVRSHFDQIILEKILTIHRLIHNGVMPQNEAAYTQLIPFSKFKDILHEDLNQKYLGEDYYLYKLIGDLHKYYQVYCIEIEENENDETLKKLSYCMKKIGELGVVEMIQFIRNIIPHREFKFSNIFEYKDHTFNGEEFQEAFLSILKDLKQPSYDSNNFFRWYADGRHFTPTAINKAATHAKEVCLRIVENAKSTDLDIMFEGNNLITSGIDVESIISHVNNIIKKPIQDEDDKNTNRITSWKKVSLVSLANVIEVIND